MFLHLQNFDGEIDLNGIMAASGGWAKDVLSIIDSAGRQLNFGFDPGLNQTPQALGV